MDARAPACDPVDPVRDFGDGVSAGVAPSEPILAPVWGTRGARSAYAVERVSVRETARRLGVSTATVYRLVEERVLDATWLAGRYRVALESVKRLLREGETRRGRMRVRADARAGIDGGRP